MAGIYIHIPFCKQACHYCDFHFSTSIKNKAAFLEALTQEIKLRKDYLKGERIATVYLGGGTPSILNADELKAIFDLLYATFDIDSEAEITLEANPDDLTKSKLAELAALPVNRLSIGIQSFFDEDLQMMNRAHNSQEALQCVQYAREAGFNNISIDLIFGLPALTNERWEANLSKAFELEVEHISAYGLTVEPRTALAHFIKTGKVKNVDDKMGAEQFEILMQRMKENEFQHYEISNFCKEGYLSKHNTSYWFNKKYLGLGPSAHSFDGISRQWNVANNNKYIKALQEGSLNYEKEALSLDQRYNEYLLTSLRTRWGADLEQIRQNFGEALLAHCLEEANPYLQNGNLIRQENKLLLSDQGKLLADKIISDLFSTR